MDDQGRLQVVFEQFTKWTELDKSLARLCGIADVSFLFRVVFLTVIFSTICLVVVVLKKKL
jgi:hypothetical protein